MFRITKVIILFIISCYSANLYAENLYDERTYQALASDRKAFKIGDLLTLLVVETARAESRAGTGSRKQTGIQASVSDTISNHAAGLSIGASSGGDAITSRQGFITAQLSVEVLSVNENGLLKVSGEQTIVINGEEQKILISGTLRKEDINRDNTILSNRLNDARIEFSGDGIVSDAQDTNVFYKILQWLGLL